MHPLRRRLDSRPIRVVVFATTVIALVAAAVLFGRIRATAEATHLDAMEPRLRALPRPVSAIVLGMGPGGDNPILDRAEVAAELWRRGYVSRFITSGGQGADEVEPESRTLRHALVAYGVPDDAIEEENRSTSTRENLLFSRPLLASTESPVLIVSHDFHAYRAEQLARRLGYEPLVVSTRGTRLRLRTYRMLREVLALVKVWLT